MVRSFDEFINRVTGAKLSDYRKHPAARVQHETAFAQMRDHVLNLYQGIEVQRSAVDPNGHIFDFVPIEQQPGLRGREMAEVPPLPPDVWGNEQPLAGPGQPAHGLGHLAGTIPMRRLTLAELTRSETLDRFFQKTRGGGDRAPPNPARSEPTLVSVRPGSAAHKYSHAFQNVLSLGGHSTLSVWNTPINLAANQIFSLSQHWYVAGGGLAGDNSVLQTFEVGWVTEPNVFGTTNPTLFVAYTANNYSTFYIDLTSNAFIQVSAAFVLGGSLIPQSVIGTQPYEIDVTVHLVAGNWWLYLATPGMAPVGVGYYPGSLYASESAGSYIPGPGLAQGAGEIDYGGEVTGYSSWPPMGSGLRGDAGYLNAAYHKNVYYFPHDGSASVAASLTKDDPSPTFYSSTLATHPAPWGTALFFGGPGGSLSITVNAPSIVNGVMTVTGTLIEYYYITALNYMDDNGVWQDVPPTATITKTTFSFVHPGMTAGSHTIRVRDGFFTQIIGTSSGFTI